MKIRYLLDENLWPQLKSAVQSLQPEIDILRVGDADAPCLGTLDPEILLYVETAQRLLVTANRSSMPAHLEHHWTLGKHIWGICWIRPQASLRELAEELCLIWGASTAAEWLDRLDWIPFRSGGTL